MLTYAQAVPERFSEHIESAGIQDLGPKRFVGLARHDYQRRRVFELGREELKQVAPASIRQFPLARDDCRTMFAAKNSKGLSKTAGAPNSPGLVS